MKRNYGKWSFMPIYEKTFCVLWTLSCIALCALLVIDANGSFDLSSTHVCIILAVFLISLIGMSWRKIRAFSWEKWRIEWALQPLYEKICSVVALVCSLALIFLMILVGTNTYKDPYRLFEPIVGVCWLCAAGLWWQRSKLNAVMGALLGLARIGIWISFIV